MSNIIKRVAATVVALSFAAAQVGCTQRSKANTEVEEAVSEPGQDYQNLNPYDRCLVDEVVDRERGSPEFNFTYENNRKRDLSTGDEIAILEKEAQQPYDDAGITHKSLSSICKAMYPNFKGQQPTPP